jgi:hypothetical protein
VRREPRWLLPLTCLATALNVFVVSVSYYVLHGRYALWVAPFNLLAVVAVWVSYLWSRRRWRA